jgi:hypothetical protein
MLKKTILVACVAAAALLALAAGTANAQGGASVDLGFCAFGPSNGSATVPAGEPITVTDGAGFASGNYGTALHAFQSLEASVTYTTASGSTTVPLTLFPPIFSPDLFAWVISSQDLSLAPLAAGESITVTEDTTPSVPVEVVFPQQKGPAPHFGPFHIGPGDTFETSCTITASS